METKENLIEPLLERVATYSKTSIELIKLKSLDKTADVASTLISRLILAIAILFFAITLNIAIALWVGDLLGKNYFGFLIVASFYALLGIILYVTHTSIKTRASNAIITQMLN